MYREPKRNPYFPRKDVPIGLWRITDQPPTHLHDHEFVEIAVVESGRGLHDFEGTVLPMEAGDLFIMPPGSRHAWVETNGVNVINVLITAFENLPHMEEVRKHPGFDPLFGHTPDLRNQREGLGRLRLDIGQLKEVVRITQHLTYSLQNPEITPASVVEIQILYLLTVLCDAYVQAPTRNRQIKLRVNHVIQYLDDHYTEEISCDELAESMHVSPATFYRLFRQAAGTTPIQHVNRLRLDHASQLLLTTDETITNIAYTVGFQDPNYFSRLFRKYKGVTPKTYRGRK